MSWFKRASIVQIDTVTAIECTKARLDGLRHKFYAEGQKQETPKADTRISRSPSTSISSRSASFSETFRKASAASSRSTSPSAEASSSSSEDSLSRTSSTTSISSSEAQETVTQAIEINDKDWEATQLVVHRKHKIKTKSLRMRLEKSEIQRMNLQRNMQNLENQHEEKLHISELRHQKQGDLLHETIITESEKTAAACQRVIILQRDRVTMAKKFAEAYNDLVRRCSVDDNTETPIHHCLVITTNALVELEGWVQYDWSSGGLKQLAHNALFFLEREECWNEIQEWNEIQAFVVTDKLLDGPIHSPATPVLEMQISCDAQEEIHEESKEGDPAEHKKVLEETAPSLARSDKRAVQPQDDEISGSAMGDGLEGLISDLHEAALGNDDDSREEGEGESTIHIQVKVPVSLPHVQHKNLEARHMARNSLVELKPSCNKHASDEELGVPSAEPSTGENVNEETADMALNIQIPVPNTPQTKDHPPPSDVPAAYTSHITGPLFQAPHQSDIDSIEDQPALYGHAVMSASQEENIGEPESTSAILGTPNNGISHDENVISKAEDEARSSRESTPPTGDFDFSMPFPHEATVTSQSNVPTEMNVGYSETCEMSQGKAKTAEPQKEATYDQASAPGRVKLPLPRRSSKPVDSYGPYFSTPIQPCPPAPRTSPVLASQKMAPQVSVSPSNTAPRSSTSSSGPEMKSPQTPQVRSFQAPWYSDMKAENNPRNVVQRQLEMYKAYAEVQSADRAGQYESAEAAVAEFTRRIGPQTTKVPFSLSSMGNTLPQTTVPAPSSGSPQVMTPSSSTTSPAFTTTTTLTKPSKVEEPAVSPIENKKQTRAQKKRENKKQKPKTEAQAAKKAEKRKKEKERARTKTENAS